MALTGLKENNLKLILFGGKGGVGKTTCAASTGIHLAGDVETLLVSTDPAHSLSDSLAQGIGDEVKGVEGVENLSGIEINAENALSRFKMEYEGQIKKILDTSTYLDEEDIESLFDLPIPGIDELMGFKTIVDLMDGANFDKYIVDTAPTGHALKLLTSPELLDDWVKVMAKMRWKYRYMVQSFAGKYKPDEADDFLLTMKKTVKRIENLLRDPDKCEFIAVTIPEDMAVLETERMIEDLNEYGIKVRQLVVNNVVEWRDCVFCRARRRGQEKYLDRMREKFDNLTITITPLQPREVRGRAALKAFSGLLTA